MIEWKISKTPIPYNQSLKFMIKRINNIYQGKHYELIWILEHPHTYTMGTNHKNKQICNINKIPIIQSNRGGNITYHGPGQIVIYILLNLNKRNKNIHYFIWQLEEIIIKTLKNHNLKTKRKNNYIGIWVPPIKNKETKIASIGIRIKKWISYHGIALNLSTNLSYFNKINPCDIKNYKMISIKKIGFNIKKILIYKTLKKNFEKIFL